MTPETIVIFALSLILLWVKPGPGQAFKITRALNDGFTPAFFVVLGIITACEIFFLVAVLGLHFVTTLFQGAGFFFKILGALYLFYLGYNGLVHRQKGRWQGRLDKIHKKKWLENYVSALVLTLANPLPIFYFLGIMPTLVPVGTFALTDVITGMLVILTVGLIVDTLLLLLVGETKKALADTKFVQNLNFYTSIGLLLLGAFFLFSALFLSDFSFDLV